MLEVITKRAKRVIQTRKVLLLEPVGLISVNPKTLMTSAPGIFAGGDCVFGPRLIIDSVADGKSAAQVPCLFALSATK